MSGTAQYEYYIVRDEGDPGDEFKSPSDGAALSKTITLACERLGTGTGTFHLYRVERVEDELLATLVLSDAGLTIEARI